mmetsp:Transcript_12605/g.32640  ORF Transcript_12605/g.32640 Transcript_12605/m.32640 type:complete len:211 (+) Transcript_12605:364-996(+)
MLAVFLRLWSSSFHGGMLGSLAASSFSFIAAGLVLCATGLSTGMGRAGLGSGSGALAASPESFFAPSFFSDEVDFPSFLAPNALFSSPITPALKIGTACVPRLGLTDSSPSSSSFTVASLGKSPLSSLMTDTSSSSSLALAASRFFDGSFLPLALGLLVVLRVGRGGGASSSSLAAAFAASPSPPDSSFFSAASADGSSFFSTGLGGSSA